MNNIKEGKLTTVASTGGIKLDDGDWINPCATLKKTLIEGKGLEQVEKFRGKIIKVEFDGEGKATKLSLVKTQPEQPGPADEGIVIKEEKLDESQEPILKDDIPREYIINLQGKEFITHTGLLLMAYRKGLQSIETDLHNDSSVGVIVFKATVTMTNGTKFTGHGDANKENVNSMIQKHMIRMAETRAINRALRFATGIGLCSIDELGGDDKEPKKKK